MDYLRSFAIGTSGIVSFQHLAALALKDKNYYDFSFKLYSIVAPIYFGLMAILSTYLRKSNNWSLEKSLFITSIISIVFVVSLNYFVSRKKYKPYKNYTNKEWL